MMARKTAKQLRELVARPVRAEMLQPESCAPGVRNNIAETCLVMFTIPRASLPAAIAKRGGRELWEIAKELMEEWIETGEQLPRRKAQCAAAPRGEHSQSKNMRLIQSLVRRAEAAADGEGPA